MQAVYCFSFFWMHLWKFAGSALTANSEQGAGQTQAGQQLGWVPSDLSVDRWMHKQILVTRLHRRGLPLDRYQFLHPITFRKHIETLNDQWKLTHITLWFGHIHSTIQALADDRSIYSRSAQNYHSKLAQSIFLNITIRVSFLYTLLYVVMYLGSPKFYIAGHIYWCGWWYDIQAFFLSSSNPTHSTVLRHVS